MNGKRVILRERAQHDVDGAVGYYLTEAGAAVALDFVDAREDACRRIGARPAADSLRLRHAHGLEFPSLRFGTLKGFP